MSGRLRVARGLRVRVDEKGVFRASVSKSSGEYVLGLEVIALLGQLNSGTPEKDLASKLKKGLVRLVEESPPSAEVQSLLSDLHECGLLVKDGASGGGAEDGFGDPWIQWAMIADGKRTEAYLHALNQVVTKDSVVLDLGAGTGIFSAFALARGAKQVIAVEESATSLAIPRMISELRLGTKGKFQLLAGNSADVRLPPGITVLVSELFGNDPFSEGVAATLGQIFPALPKGVKVIPQTLTLHAELANLTSGSIFHRVAAYSRPRGGGSGSADTNPEAFLGAFCNSAKSVLDFSDLSFPAALGAGECERLGKPHTLRKLALGPLRDSEWLGGGSCEFSVTRAMPVPVILLWYRVELIKGMTISSFALEPDGCEHWSPIVVPLRRGLAKGEVVSLAWGISEEKDRIVAEITASGERIGGRGS